MFLHVEVMETYADLEITSLESLEFCIFTAVCEWVLVLVFLPVIALLTLAHVR
jgi:hypothetical protein